MKDSEYCEGLRHAVPPVSCFKMGQWHQFTTVVIKRSYEKDLKMIENVKVICAKCGVVADPFKDEQV